MDHGASPDESVPVASESAGDVLGILQKVWALNHGLHAISKRMERKLGVTGHQRLMVRLIGERPGISAGEMATILHLHPSTLTGLTRRLERQGLIRRLGIRQDGRRIVYQLTAGGRRISNHRDGTFEEVLHRVLKELPPEKVEAAKEVLESLVLGLRLAEDPDTA